MVLNLAILIKSHISNEGQYKNVLLTGFFPPTFLEFMTVLAGYSFGY